MSGTKKWIGPLLILCCVVFGSTPVPAYVSEGPCVDLDNSNMKVSGFISTSEVDYEFDVPNTRFGDVEVERKIIGFDVTKRIIPELDVYGALGYLFDGSLKPDGGYDIDLDSGYFLSAGIRYMIYQADNISFHLFGQLDYILNEEYSDNVNGVNFDYELDDFELSVGGAVRFQIDSKFSAFAGLSFVPLSNTSYDLNATGNLGPLDWDGSVERDDKLGLRTGASYLINNRWSIRGEADFISEKTFLVSAGLKF
jgi:hypothetical protein